jgi:hypothetical protein
MPRAAQGFDSKVLHRAIEGLLLRMRVDDQDIHDESSDQ